MYTHKKPKSELGFTKSTIFYIELIKNTISKSQHLHVIASKDLITEF